MTMREIAAAAAILLLALASSASAECAWVLWVVRSDQRPVPGEFDIAATYTKVTECVAKLDETAQAFRAPTTTVVRDASTVLHVMFRGRDGLLRSRDELAMRSRHRGPTRAEGGWTMSDYLPGVPLDACDWSEYPQVLV